MKPFAQPKAAVLSISLLMMLSMSIKAQTVVITNYTFDAAASATPPAWRVWNSGIAQYITNQWNSSDVSNNPSSGSLLITSTFSGASQQSVVWTGDYTPPLDGTQITNFSCYVRFDPSSPTNATSKTFGTVVFYLDTAPGGAYGDNTQIPTSSSYYSVPANNTNWVYFSVPVNIGSSIYGIMIQLQTYGNALTGTSKMYVDNVRLTGGTLVTNPPISGTSTVDWNNVHQRIDGFGASSAYNVNGTWSTAEADLLFSTNNNISYQSATYNGIGLSLLRNHIVPAGSSSASDTPTTAETSNMLLAQARGARVWSAPWSPAAGFKGTNDIYDTNTATASGIDGGSFLGGNATNQAYASQLANYVVSMKNTYTINLYAISIQNEPDANVTTYDACQWTNTYIHDFVTNLYNALAAKGVGSTKIILPESQNWQDYHNLAGPAMSDPDVAADVSIVACHNYDGANGPASLVKNNYGKALWETEVSQLGGETSDIGNGVYYAQRVYLFLTQAQANAWHYWWIVPSGSETGLMTQSAGTTKRMFTIGQYSRFVRPNNYRIDATSSQPSALISAYKATNSTAFAIVVVNTNAATNVDETFNLSNFTTTSVTPWITSASLSLAPQTPVNVTGSSFTYTVPAMSVVTFVGQASFNTAPTIAPVANRTNNVGVTLVITNVASDSDAPAQTLTFSPAKTLPANATLVGTNGVFTWRPLVSQANTTNLISVQVTDSGTPSLSATNSFTVVVNAVTNPIVNSVAFSGGQVNLAVSGPQGPDYTLLTTTNLMIGWQALFTTNSPGTPFIFVDTNSTDAARFYRLQIGP